MLSNSRFAFIDFTLVKVRLLQLRREFSTLGILHKLLFAGLLLASMGLFGKYYQKQPAAFYVMAIPVLLVLSAQLFRPDKTFVMLHLNRPKTTLFYEYLIFTVPFTLPLLFTANWYCFPVFPLAFGLIIQTKFTVRNAQSRFNWLGKIIPAQEFEWISGLRQGFPGFALIYLAALAFCWVKVLPLFLLWLLNTLLLSFYQEAEPLQLLRIYAETPKLLVRKKLLAHSKLLMLLNLPVIAFQAVFHPVIGLVGLGFLVLQLSSLAFAIFLKYSTYVPNRSSGSNTFLLSLVQLGIILPFLLPLPLVMCFRYYGRAKRNLAFYLPK